MAAQMLYTACAENNCTRVLEILEDGLDIDDGIQNPDYEYYVRPLHIAAYNGAIDVVTLLVERGANINAISPGKYYQTALHIAIIKNRTEVVSYLLLHGADVSCTDANGSTPLHYAMQYMVIAADIVKSLLANGADVNARSGSGKTPLHNSGLIHNECEDKTSILLAAGANIDAQTNLGNTFLHFCVINDNICAVRFLLEHGAATDIRNKKGKTAVDLAKDEAISALLLEHIASQNVKNAGRRK